MEFFNFKFVIGLLVDDVSPFSMWHGTHASCPQKRGVSGPNKLMSAYVLNLTYAACSVLDQYPMWWQVLFLIVLVPYLGNPCVLADL